MDPDPPFPELPPELLASLFWQAAEGMFVADSRGRVFVVNTRGCELLGYAPGEILGRPFTDFMVAEDLKATPVRLDELRAGKTVVSERRLRRKDGRQFPVEITTRMLPSGYLLGIGRDITDRRRTEQVLRESESRYRTLFEAANDAILLVEDARFVDCNARTLEIFGCSREWILGHHPADSLLRCSGAAPRPPPRPKPGCARRWPESRCRSIGSTAARTAPPSMPRSPSTGSSSAGSLS